jgi:superfamily II DNA helicase RecQ
MKRSQEMAFQSRMEKLDSALSDYFGFTSFKSGQREVMAELLCERDVGVFWYVI